MEDNTMPVAAPAPATPSPAPTPAQSSSPADPKTNAMIAWIFAPFSSYLLRDEKDEFVRAHARESFYLGVANIIALLALGVLNVCYGMIFNVLFWNVGLGLASLLSCVWGILWLAVALFIGVPRVVGIIKANNHEKWTVPYVTENLSKYIKF